MNNLIQLIKNKFIPKKNKLVISLHIPKTGGITFRDFLMNHVYKDDFYIYHPFFKKGDPGDFAMNLYKLEDDKTLPKEINIWEKRRFFVPKNAKCVHGHFKIKQIQNAKNFDIDYVTWVRDPAQRIMSHIDFINRWEHKLGENSTQVKNKPLEEAILSTFMTDLMNRITEPLKVDNFTFIGITEEFDKSIKLFCKIYGVEPPPSLENVNVNPNKQLKSKYEIEPEIQDLIRQNNPKDYEFYEKAKNKFEKLCKKYDVN